MCIYYSLKWFGCFPSDTKKPCPDLSPHLSRDREATNPITLIVTFVKVFHVRQRGIHCTANPISSDDLIECLTLDCTLFNRMKETKS